MVRLPIMIKRESLSIWEQESFHRLMCFLFSAIVFTDEEIENFLR